MKLSIYLEELASSASTPGGGSASAVSGMLGISLIQMAISLTKNKKKYIEYAPIYEMVEKTLTESKAVCEWGMDEDAVAFDKVMALYHKKPTPEEQEDYNKQLQEAFIYAAEVPLKVAKAIRDAMAIANVVKDKLNPWVVSDLIGGMEALNGAIRSVLLNVAINVKSLSEGADKERLHAEMVECLQITIAAYEEMREYLYKIDTFKELK